VPIQLAQCWFPMLRYTYIFQIKYTETILSNSTRKLLWFEISKMLISLKKKFTVLFIIIFGTLSLRASLPAARAGDQRRAPAHRDDAVVSCDADGTG